MRVPAIPGFDPQAFEKYFKNTGWLITGRVGSLAIKMLVGFALANYLGKEQNGILNYANAFVFIFFSLAGLGLDSFIVRELVRMPQHKNKILGTSFLMKFSAGLAAIPVILLVYLLFPGQNTPIIYILILSFIGVFQSFTVIDSYFQSQVQAKFIMRVNIAANIISAGIKLLFIWLQLPLIFFIGALLADAVVLGFGYVFVYRSKSLRLLEWKFDKGLAKSLLQKSWPLMFSAVLITIYMKIDQLMIGRMLGSDALGIYSTAVPFSEAWYFIPMSIVASVFPAIIHAKAQNEQRYQKRLQNLYDLMIAISLSIALLITFASDWIYSLLLKPEYAPGAAVLDVHIWSGLFVFLGIANSQYLINEGLTQLSLVRTAVGAVTNVVLNLIFIPSMGIIGAAWATLIAYGVSTFFVIFIRKTRLQALMMLKSLFLISLIQKVISFRKN